TQCTLVVNEYLNIRTSGHDTSYKKYMGAAQIPIFRLEIGNGYWRPTGKSFHRLAVDFGIHITAKLKIKVCQYCRDRPSYNEIWLNKALNPNFEDFAFGALAISLSIWMLVDQAFLITLSQDQPNFYAGLYILLAAGTLMFIISFLGCCGAYKESQCMLVSFFSCILIVIVAQIATAAWLYANSNRLEELVKSSIQASIKNAAIEYSEIDKRGAKSKKCRNTKRNKRGGGRRGSRIKSTLKKKKTRGHKMANYTPNEVVDNLITLGECGRNYRLPALQELSEADYVLRVQFCRWALKVLDLNPNFFWEYEYSIIPTRTQIVDSFQQNLGCCGATSPNDWAGSKFSSSDGSSEIFLTVSKGTIFIVPKSCCKNETSFDCDTSRKIRIADILPSAIYDVEEEKEAMDEIKEEIERLKAKLEKAVTGGTETVGEWEAKIKNLYKWAGNGKWSEDRRSKTLDKNKTGNGGRSQKMLDNYPRKISKNRCKAGGCTDRIIREFKKQSGILFGVIISLGLLEVIASVFSLILCCAIGSNDRYKA
ncbi:hypothetical protein TSAR_004417, partial [Trichomalopsis sarcophagae]